MTKRENYEKRTEELLMPMITENNFELVDVEYVKEAGTWYLRIYIDKEGGITVNDCELINRQLGDLMDEEDFIEESYVLEVSSPGLDRKLKKDKDFARSIGKDVDIHLFKPLKTETATYKAFEAKLLSYDQDSIKVQLQDENEIDIKRSDISVIKLAIDF